jgi:transcriptional regulator with XRE-family HTH domain
MYYYKRLRDLREDADKSQADIGKLLSTTQQQYAKYESGIQQIPAHHLITLASYYNVSTDYLLGLTDVRKAYPKSKSLSSNDTSR